MGAGGAEDLKVTDILNNGEAWLDAIRKFRRAVIEHL